jgi:hypothetical protein
VAGREYAPSHEDRDEIGVFVIGFVQGIGPDNLLFREQTHGTGLVLEKILESVGHARPHAGGPFPFRGFSAAGFR